MTRDVLAERILRKILSHPRLRGMNPQSVRNAISKIHRDPSNYGVTMNAAAQEYARTKGFSVYKSLSPEDKKSLQFLKSGTPAVPTREREFRRRKVDVKPSFGSLFVREANDNASTYFYVYILENELRGIIFDKLGRSQTWWTDEAKVSKEIQEYSARIEEAEKKYPWLKKRGDHPVYYVGLYELFKIIEKNWKIFRDVFRDLELLRAWIKESVPIRNLIAHNVNTRPQERQNIKIRTDYIVTLVRKWHDSRSKKRTSRA